MTDYTPPRSSQDLNHLMVGPQLTMSHFTNHDIANYNYIAHPHYESCPPTYSTFANPLLSSQHQGAQYLADTLQMAAQYQYGTPSYHRNPSQAGGYSFHPPPQQHLMQTSRYLTPCDSHPYEDIEGQESMNEDTMLSEPCLPSLEGFPHVSDFDLLVKGYVKSLSSKKQDKALIHARRARNIKAVLIDKKTTAVESAQFRFWVKKMFTLMPSDSKTPDRKRKICHEGKPVAVREKLFKILTNAHKQCQHGGRDKTSAQVRRTYSWVPKELISRFVKLCPTCKARRGSNPHTSPPTSPANQSSVYSPPESPGIHSPDSRRSSLMSRHSSILPSSSVGTNVYGSPYPGSQWLSSSRNTQIPPDISSGASNGTPSSSAMGTIGNPDFSLEQPSSGLQHGNVDTLRSYSYGQGGADRYLQYHDC